MCQLPEETRVAFLIEMLKEIDNTDVEFTDVFNQLKEALFVTRLEPRNTLASKPSGPYKGYKPMY
ncbi:hypothetical protein [Bacillus safensis]|uniref:hypothetical protein n=1 Tax=Bacillus TaxID=1386 RepID=UPI00226D1604|nr:hypothetical protein [Bacillus safensis]MCY1093978.1 hypothetical protein [Bacillus safensis]